MTKILPDEPGDFYLSPKRIRSAFAKSKDFAAGRHLKRTSASISSSSVPTAVRTLPSEGASKAKFYC